MLLLVVVAILAGASAATLSLGSRMERAGIERELRWREQQYANAIASYAAVNPGTAHGPHTVAELLRDPRAPGVVRHLRRAYENPLTMESDWREIRDRSGAIIAICRPLVRFDPPDDGVRRDAEDPCAAIAADAGLPASPAPSGALSGVVRPPDSLRP